MNEEDLLHRIENLERISARNRTLFITCVVCFLALASLVLAPRRTLRAKELILTDSLGNSVVRLKSNKRASCLEMMGATQATSAELCAGDGYGSTLLLKNGHNMSTVFLSAGATPEGAGVFAPGLTISENGGQRQFVTLLGEEMKLSLVNGGDSSSFVISIRGSQPVVTVTDSGGRLVWTAPSHETARLGHP
jgi:hypothetical protein